MTVRGVRIRLRSSRRLLLAGAAAWCALGVGCKSSDGDRKGLLGLGLFDRGGDSGGAVASRGDPLLGGKIPPQNLPVHSKDGLASRGDPLLGTPAGRGVDTPPEKTEKTDKVGQRKKNPGEGGDAALPPRRDEPYRPSRETTNAALAAGRIDPNDPKLAIDPDRRPRATPAAFIPRGEPTGRTFDEIAGELKNQYEALVGSPERDRDGNYVVRAEVPIDAGQPGRLRAYEGSGPTAAAAAKQVLDQVRDDRRK